MTGVFFELIPVTMSGFSGTAAIFSHKKTALRRARIADALGM
jgi:hypothetical protein